MGTTGTLDWKPGRRKLNGGGWIRPVKRLAIYIRDGFQCAYCGCALRNADPRNVTLDHLQPRCEGGTNHESNLITACRSCNSARGAKPWQEYATGGAVERIERLVLEALNMGFAQAILDGTAGDAEIEAAR